MCWECPRPVLRVLSQDAGPVPVHPVVYMHLPLLMFKEVYVTIGPGNLDTDCLLCSSFVAESTLSSRICSSEAFLHFLIVCPFLMLLLLFASLLCLCWKARKLSQLSLSAQKEKALWVDMKRASGDWTTGRKTEDAEPQGEPMLMEGM